MREPGHSPPCRLVRILLVLFVVSTAGACQKPSDKGSPSPESGEQVGKGEQAGNQDIEATGLSSKPGDPNQEVSSGSGEPITLSRYHVAEPQIDDADRSRFELPLPSTLAALDDPAAHPPLTWFRRELCAGNQQVRKRWLDALANVETTGEDRQDHVRQLVTLTWRCEDDLLTWIASVFDQQPADAQAILVDVAAYSASPAALPILEKDAATLEQVYDYYSRWNHQAHSLPAHSRAMEAFRGAFNAAPKPFHIKKVANALSHMNEVDSLRILQELQQESSDPTRSAHLALSQRESSLPEAQAAFQAACAQLPNESLCGDDVYTGEPPPLPEFDEELVSKVEDLGFIPGESGVYMDGYGPQENDGTDLLVSWGYVAAFDMETGQYPNGHDQLLYFFSEFPRGDAHDELRMPLSEVEFDEVAPHQRTGRDDYLLRAWAGDKQYSLNAANLGEWYDVNAVVGLLNSLAINTGSEIRFLRLQDGGQVAFILAAPDDQISALLQNGLVTPFAEQDR